MVQASVPEWDYVSHNSVLCSSVSTSSCDAFWLGRSGAAYVLRIPRACSSSCRLCCTCKRSQSCSVNTQQRSKQVPQGPGGKGGVQTGTKMHQQCLQVRLSNATSHQP